MGMLAGVKRGKVKQPILAIAYGPDGVGKSTFAAGAPNCIFLGTERGTANLDVARFPSPKNFKDVLTAINELINEKHDFESLAIDSLDWLEALVWEQVCIDNNWKAINEPGYGDGYVAANKMWQEMMSSLTRLRDTRGMNIVAIAHTQAKLQKDPQLQAEYDRYILKLNEKAAAMWREYVDCVLFINYETFTKKEKGKTKAFGESSRYIFTERRPGFDAKNRLGLPFQIELPIENGWGEFMNAVESANPSDPTSILAQINVLVMDVKDQDLLKKIKESVEKANGNVAMLEKIFNRAQAALNQ
jgi:hypothetical protein